MFLHGGWMHLIFNMLYMWVFADNIEDAMGPVRFIISIFCAVPERRSRNLLIFDHSISVHLVVWPVC